MAGQITFWEGNGGTQDQVGNTLNGGQNYNIDCKSGDHGFSNDEARSLKLQNIPSGITVIKVYDSPSASESDDWARVTVMGPVDEAIVGTFNSDGSYADGKVKCDSTYINGLDGKISKIMIDYIDM
ncbi:hypothetical protein L6J37_18995 [Photobacterium sp. WH77]|uniref:hypothetical protein n=1 Tax=Photobacterium TaxID=657 RepID=UPI001EDA5541|nr:MULTISPECIES: hypothetical protein [Photobacterium]MCG2838927.1 hypothetical protein [Photobacterium sp. WH77]MCG2846544.1 hypothetical protein [Photobacterium sp. WH80]MDO6583203.1 hypothetical protein [Photobacterium sp. 2_MG-2023]